MLAIHDSPRETNFHESVDNFSHDPEIDRFGHVCHVCRGKSGYALVVLVSQTRKTRSGRDA